MQLRGDSNKPTKKSVCTMAIVKLCDPQASNSRFLTDCGGQHHTADLLHRSLSVTRDAHHHRPYQKVTFLHAPAIVRSFAPRSRTVRILLLEVIYR